MLLNPHLRQAAKRYGAFKMKGQLRIITFLLILFGKVSFAQTICDKAIIKAQTDFNGGNYCFHSLEFQPTDNTYLFVLRQDYDIQWLFTEEDSLSYYNCYDSTMIYYLNKKFGNNFLKIASTKADSLEKTDNWRKEPEYPSGNFTMLQFINDRLIIKQGDLGERRQVKIYVKFIITESGKLEDIEVIRGVNKQIDSKILQIFKEMPKWTPAYLYGKPIRRLYTYPIKLEIK